MGMDTGVITARKTDDKEKTQLTQANQIVSMIVGPDEPVQNRR